MDLVALDQLFILDVTCRTGLSALGWSSAFFGGQVVPEAGVGAAGALAALGVVGTDAAVNYS